MDGRCMIWVVGLLVACGSSAERGGKPRETTTEGSSSAAPPVTATAATAAATAAPSAARVGPALRALMEASNAASTDAAGSRWLLEAREARAVSHAAPLPAAVARVAAALRAWAVSGEAAPVPEVGEDSRALMTVCSNVMALVGAAARSEDLVVADALQLSLAMRAADNAALVIITGCNLVAGVTRIHVMDRKQPVTPAMRSAKMTEADLLHAARSDARYMLSLARMISWQSIEKEGLASIGLDLGLPAGPKDPDESSETWDQARLETYRRQHGLPVAAGWLRRDYDDYARFWEDTERRLQGASDLKGVIPALEERRRTALAHPTSMLVRLLGDLLLGERMPKILRSLQSELPAHQALLGG